MIKQTTITLIAISTCITASAVTLVEVDFSGAGAVGTYATSDSQFTTINSAVTFDDSVNALSAIGAWNYDGTGTAATNGNLHDSSTFGSPQRFDFDLGNAATGLTYTITSVELDIRANNDDGSTFQFGYRDTGGDAQIIGSELIGTQGGADPIGTHSIALSGLGLTATDSSTAWNISGTGELRFIFFDATTDAVNDNFQVAGMRIIGTVPEPSSYALLAGLCALSAIALRRRA